jgi:hypothetical protein
MALPLFDVRGARYRGPCEILNSEKSWYDAGDGSPENRGPYKTRDELAAIKRLESADGLRRADIQANGQGQFRFTEEPHLTEDGYSFWSPSHFSGQYDSADAAERSARMELP